MGHLLLVHETHQLTHELFCPKSLIPPRIKEAAATLPLCPGPSDRTCAQTPPSSSSPTPLRPPPPHRRSLCSRRRHRPCSCRRRPCSRCHRSCSRHAVVAPSHAALSPLLVPPSPLLALLKKTKVTGHLNLLERLAA
jgi:hypothetical protein